MENLLSSFTLCIHLDELLLLAVAKNRLLQFVMRYRRICAVSFPLKIMVNYASAADFIADNTTAAGRAENQRVEIDLVHVPPNQP